MNNKECIAQYLYNIIRDGQYKDYKLYSGNATVIISRSWWRSEKINIEVCWGKSAFTYRNVEIRSELAKDALEILKARNKAKNNIAYHNALQKITKDLRLNC